MSKLLFEKREGAFALLRDDKDRVWQVPFDALPEGVSEGESWLWEIMGHWGILQPAKQPVK